MATYLKTLRPPRADTKHTATPAEVLKLIKDKGGIYLDVGCGQNKQPQFCGMDIRPLPGVDIVHDMEDLPWPLPDECCLSVLASHVVEHVNPARFGFVNWMNEAWRVIKPGGRLMIACPYGANALFVQDPTHCNAVSEVTLMYFAPEHASGLWNIYRPKPWRIITNAWASNGCLEAVMQKLLVEEGQPPANGNGEHA